MAAPDHNDSRTSQRLRTRCRRRWGRWLGLAWLAASGGVASVGAQDLRAGIVEVTEPGYTGFIVDDTPGLAAIWPRAVVSFSTATATPITQGFRLVYRWLDEAEQPVPVLDASGRTVTAVTHDVWVTLPTGPGGLTRSVTYTNQVSLKPQIRLARDRSYRVALALYRWQEAQGEYLPLGVVRRSEPRTYIHLATLAEGGPDPRLLVTFEHAELTRAHLVQTVPGLNAFLAEATVTLRRFEQVDRPVRWDEHQVRLDVVVREADTGRALALRESRFLAQVSVPSYQPAPLAPAVVTTSVPLPLEPLALPDPVARLYTIEVTLAYAGPDGVWRSGGVQTLAGRRLLGFNGRLRFGDVLAEFHQLDNVPPVLSVGADFVATEILVPAGGGSVVGKPAHTFGGPSALAVRLRPDGEAEFAGTVVEVRSPEPDLDTLNGIRLRRSPEGAKLQLTPTGAVAVVDAILPAGFGISPARGQRVLQPFLRFGAVPLNQALLPAATALVYRAPGGRLFQAHEETSPFWIQSRSLTWDVARGEFHLESGSRLYYAREPETLELELARADPAVRGAEEKRSNELLFRSVSAIRDGPIVVRPDARGRARLTLGADLGPGEFRAHFPYDARVRWTGPGRLDLVEGVPAPASSALEGAAVTVAYRQDCPDAACGNDPPRREALELEPNGGRLRFTRDSGLQAEGTLNRAATLRWGFIRLDPQFQLGLFAQQAGPFATAAFQMAGTALRTDGAVPADDGRPGVLLLSGTGRPGDPDYLERPGTAGYALGLADYPGLNFRAADTPPTQGNSRLGGEPFGPYQLTARAKYCVREGGVTGIQEARSGSFPPSARIYGYRLDFDHYGFSYRDGANLDSRTQGRIEVGGPANLLQEFESLRLTCRGGLLGARIPASAGPKQLEYWQADLVPLSLEFRAPPGQACDPGVGFLVLGVRAFCSAVPEPLFGFLGFKANGNLITRADNLLPDVDSRLKLPAAIRLRGPGEAYYTLYPVTEAYFNNWEASPRPRAGFLNLAGKLDVAFFRDLEVHWQTSARSNSPSATVDMMRGWSDAAGRTFFTSPGFDAENRGFPPEAADLNAYTRGAAFYPHARQEALGVISLDYPVQWFPATRTFRSPADQTDRFLVLEVKNQVTHLDPQHAELRFGAEFNRIPQLDAVNFLVNQITEQTGTANAVRRALGEPTQAALGAGLAALDRVLSPRLDLLADETLRAVLDSTVDRLYARLEQEYRATGSPANFPALIQAELTTQLPVALPGVAGINPATPGLVRDLDAALDRALAAVDALGRVLGRAGDRGRVGELANALAGEFIPQFAGNVSQGLGGRLQEAEPTLQALERALATVRAELERVRTSLSAPAGLGAELRSRLSVPADLAALAQRAAAEVTTWFAGLDYGRGSPFDDPGPEVLRAAIHRRLADQFRGSPAAARVHSAIKQYLYDVDAALREVTDSVFQQVNLLLRDALVGVAQDLDAGWASFLGGLSDLGAAAHVSGYAQIRDESLTKLRLDGRFQLRTQGDMEFNAYLQMCELDSAGPPGCRLAPGDRGTEVSLGADEVKLGWILPDLRFSVGTRFTFINGGLAGLAGKFKLRGSLKYGVLEVQELAAAAGFASGSDYHEHYFSGAARLSVSGWEGAGGLFFGKTCTLEPIQLWAPDVAQVIGRNDLTGIYAYGEVWIPLNELIGIPSSCFLKLAAGMGSGFFYFDEGIYGGKMLLGVSGEVLCIIQLKGDIYLVGRGGNGGFKLVGRGELEAELGPCPFCLSFGFGFGMTFDNGTFTTDF